MGREFELKYAASPEKIREISSNYQNLQEMQMETTYYDTPHGSLGTRRWTLRRRMENGVSVCTLKTPAGAARGEWETECDDILEAIPALCRLGAPAELLEVTEVVPVCAARFTRLFCPVPIPGGLAELALDAGVLLGGGREEPFWEVEAELKEGSEESLTQFANALAQKYGLNIQPKSKFKRALELAKGER